MRLRHIWVLTCNKYNELFRERQLDSTLVVNMCQNQVILAPSSAELKAALGPAGQLGAGDKGQ